jgi:hypothetical protein
VTGNGQQCGGAVAGRGRPVGRVRGAAAEGGARSVGRTGAARGVGGRQPVAHLLGVHPHHALQLHAQPRVADVRGPPRRARACWRFHHEHRHPGAGVWRHGMYVMCSARRPFCAL